MTPERIDIAIVNFRCAGETLQALARLAPWRHGTVWVVNNNGAASDAAGDTAALAAGCAALGWVRLLDADANLGFGSACNLAFALSTAPFFLLLNPDARMDEPDILALVDGLQRDDGLAAVAPTLYWNAERSFLIPYTVQQTPAALLRSVLATRWAWWARWLAHRHLRTMQRMAAQSRSFTVDFLTGAALMLRRNAIQQMAPKNQVFDSDYFMFFEDTDLSLRLRRAGWRLAVQPQAQAVHEYRHKPFKAALMHQARAQFFIKNHKTFFLLTRGLRWVDALMRSVSWQERFEKISGPLQSAADFGIHTHGAAVLAFSPSVLATPVLWRPQHARTCPFNAAEWALLEPGYYAALLQHPQGGPPRWVCFERLPSASV